MKCEYSDECNEKAEYECISCGTTFCKICAENSDYECDCVVPPVLVPITKKRVGKANNE